MSRIDRMNIIGIRSFPIDHGESIEFFTPLTLVVGINGSGKTTIIECLKYATTGIQPPNSKVGGAFVHDPKLTIEREIMAQIKLQFYSNKSARMVLTRSLQLTVKKTSRSLKALEGSLLIERHGERTVLSSRVAELDTVMPTYLGVSQAVLDNVIFCHQDESLWPLSEPSALKKKFDEIFESQKYTKAIDNIKQIRKKNGEDLAKHKIMAQHAKEDKERSEKMRERTEKLHDEIEKLRVECTDLQNKMNTAQERADMLWKSSEEYSRILGALEGKQIEAKSRQQIVDDLKVHLSEVEESDEWLEETLEKFDTKMARYQDQKEIKGEQWLEWKDKIKDYQDQLSAKLAEQGKHQQEKEEHARQTERRREMVETAASRHQIRGFDDLTDESVVDRFLYKIRHMARERTSALEKARIDSSSEKQEIVKSINKMTVRKEALQDNKDTLRRQIGQNEQEASEYQRQIDSIKVDEGSKAVIDSRIDDVQQKIQNLRSTVQSADWEIKLRNANLQLRSQEDDGNRLNEELVQSTKRAGEVARLSHLKQELKAKKRSLETLMNAHKTRIDQLIGSEWDAATIERVQVKILDHATDEVVRAEKDRDTVSKDMSEVKFRQKTVRDDIAQNKAQAASDADAVRTVIDADLSSYDDVLQTATENVEAARDEAKGLGGLIDYFNSCLRTFGNAKPSCRTCQRAFKSADDPALANARNKLKGLVDRVTKEVEEAKLAEVEAAYQAVVDVGARLSNWKKLTTELIPALELQLNSLTEQKDGLLAKLERHDTTVQQKQSERKDIEATSRTVASIARHATDIASYELQIEEVSAKQSQKASIKTHEDIQEDIKTLNEQIRKTKSVISTLSTEQSTAQNQLHELELHLSGLNNERSVADSQLEKKVDLLRRVDECKARSQKQREIIDKTDQDIQAIDPRIATAKAQHDDVEQRWASRISDLTRETTQFGESLSELDYLNKQISSYIERGGDKRLSVVAQEIQSLRRDVEQVEKTQTQLTREISEIDGQLRDSETTKRHYSDNLRYRRETRALEQLNEDIAELSSRNAKAHRDRFEAESREVTRQYQLYSGEREGKLGEMKTKDNVLKDLLDDFKTDLLDAPRRYREALIKVETTKAAMADLQVFGSALDNAVMKFHGVKMEQVNEIISNLWQKTYKGSDVDRIMIRSDSEASASATTARGRSYNYRVVMVKQGVEMDMRGRCSAGQKVLASIIIRLALADVFSQDCGLIALDEPTTNLDHDNIVSLAQSLHEIIRERQRQKNFQLIIITHDEDFLGAINPSEFCDHYYRVSRDKDGNSMIEKQDIYLVGK